MKIQYMHHVSGNECRLFLILDFLGGLFCVCFSFFCSDVRSHGVKAEGESGDKSMLKVQK